MKQGENIKSSGAKTVYLFACMLFLSIIFTMHGSRVSEPENLFKNMFVCSIAVCCALLAYWRYTDALTEDKLVFVLFAAAFAARLCYILSVPVTVNQHDTYWFGYEGENNGHTGYIQYLMENRQLPDFDVSGQYQFYHPPLHHIAAAVWMKIQMAFGVTFELAAENLQALTLFYSMAALYASYRVLKLLGLKGMPLLLPLSLNAFHPAFFLLSGSINNDCMSVMFIMLAVWVALEWFQKQTVVRIILLAFCIGCAMFAKLSAGLIAPAVAFLFLYRLYTAEGWRSRKRLLLQFVVFGLICIPLGIGWQIRNYVLFDVPLTYVPRLSNEVDQYLGDYSVAERFFDFHSLSDFGVYPMRTGEDGAAYFEHCIPLAALKMALFGEYSVWKNIALNDAFCNLLFWANLVLVAASVTGMGCCIFHVWKKEQPASFYQRIGFGKAVLIFLLLLWGCMVGSYVKFCFDYPHFCSMDFRYIVPTVPIGAVFLGVLLSHLARSRKQAAIIVRSILTASAAAFVCCAVIAYPLTF